MSSTVKFIFVFVGFTLLAGEFANIGMYARAWASGIVAVFAMLALLLNYLNHP